MLAKILQKFERVFDAYEHAGFELFLVGGAVRDALMGLGDRADYDFATNAKPDDSVRILEGAGMRTFPIGARFGTIATIDGDNHIEITTYRVAEHYEAGNRKPVVEFGDDIRVDLSRRDLSINAIAADRHGNLVDPFDGATAIEERKLEVPGGGYDNTISILNDDPLRLLRIGRFVARIAFDPTDETNRAALATHEGLQSISRERWKMEMDKILVAPKVVDGLVWLTRVRALQEIVPSVSALDALGGLRVAAEQIARCPVDPVVRWACLLLHCVAADAGELLNPSAPPDRWPTVQTRRKLAEQTSKRFRFSNDERQRVSRAVALRLSGHDLSAPERPFLRRWLTDPGPQSVDDQLSLLDAMLDNSAATAAIREAISELTAEEDPVPKLPRGMGHRIKEDFDVDGELLGRAMHAIREMIFDGIVPNHSGARTYLHALRDHPERWRESGD